MVEAVSNGPGKMLSPELSRMDEIIQQISESNSRFNFIKDNAYNIASRLGGPWPSVEEKEEEGKQLKEDEDREPTKLERLSSEVNHYHRQLNELEGIIDRLRGLV